MRQEYYRYMYLPVHMCISEASTVDSVRYLQKGTGYGRLTATGNYRSHGRIPSASGPLQLGVAQTPMEGRSLVCSQVDLSCQTSSSCDKSSFHFDKLNCKHYITPHTGPAVVCVRAGKFYSSTSLTRVLELTHILKAIDMGKRTAVTHPGLDLWLFPLF